MPRFMGFLIWRGWFGHGGQQESSSAAGCPGQRSCTANGMTHASNGGHRSLFPTHTLYCTLQFLFCWSPGNFDLTKRVKILLAEKDAEWWRRAELAEMRGRKGTSWMSGANVNMNVGTRPGYDDPSPRAAVPPPWPLRKPRRVP